MAWQTTATEWHAVGLKHAQASDYELAEPALAEACRLESRRPGACYQLGRVRYLLNRFAGAIAPLEQSLANGEPAGRAKLALAQAREGLDEPTRAEPLFREAVKLGVPDAPLRLAMFLLRQGRVDESAAMAQKAVEANPKSPAALVEWARAENQLERYESARAHLEQAVALAPDYAAAHQLLARVCRRLGDAAAAQRHQQKAGAAR
ncbi:MAG: tetratricopeptide repeat protein [Bryobacterales bacterium]|nr:tetratricopeptide repeat protein [Bryobacterales bacterium]